MVGHDERERRARYCRGRETSVRLDDIGAFVRASHATGSLWDRVIYAYARFFYFSFARSFSMWPTGTRYTTRVTCPSRERVK